MNKFILIILFFFAVRAQSAEQVENESVKGSVISQSIESLVDYPCLEECSTHNIDTQSEIAASDETSETLSPHEFTYAGYPRTTLMGTAALKKTSSAAVGTGAPPAPPDVADHFVPAVPSQFAVPPTQ